MNSKPLALAGLLLASLAFVPTVAAAVAAPADLVEADGNLAAYYACLGAGIDPSICKDLLVRLHRICAALASPWYEVCYHLA